MQEKYSYLTHDIAPVGRIKKKRKFSREFGLHWLYRTPCNFVVRLTSLRRHDDVKFQNVLRQRHYVW